MHRNSLYLGILVVTGLLLAGCSLLPASLNSTIMEDENQEIQAEMPEESPDQGQDTTTTTKPSIAPSAAPKNTVDLPSLESDLGSLTLEEERFE